jgi:oligoribonuclease NrnB/cAMP/cGMP phosphodiesterase (DHH superfamily)
MKTTVIHHNADFDGLFCREIARKFLPEAELVGWDFGQPQIDPGNADVVYILDLPPESVKFDVDGGPFQSVIWIDHHKSSIEKWGERFPGYRIDGVAACRLAWQWFTTPRLGDKTFFLPGKDAFLNRSVSEPLAVRLAGEYDVWDHRDDKEDITFQFGLRAQEEINWHNLLNDDRGLVRDYIAQGRLVERYSRKGNAEVIKAKGFDLEFEGLTFLALNTTKKSSTTFEAGVQEHHDGCLAFSFNGKVWTISMYGVDHKRDIDLSKIAVKFGGGGHRNACGFQTPHINTLLQ